MTIKLPLSRGKEAIVDDVDSDLATKKWSLFANKYASREKLSLHRVIMQRIVGREIQKEEFVIAKDGDFLNCTRDNLFITTRSKRMLTIDRPFKHNTSGYRGVAWHQKRNKWVAFIIKDGKQKHLGCFNTKEEAAQARKSAEESL